MQSRAGSFSEFPSETEVADFCAAWPGDGSRGIPASVPEVWWRKWLAWQQDREKMPPPGWQWRAALVSRFKADFVNRIPEAHGQPRAQTAQKNAPPGNRPAPFARETSTGRMAPEL